MMCTIVKKKGTYSIVETKIFSKIYRDVKKMNGCQFQHNLIVELKTKRRNKGGNGLILMPHMKVKVM